MFKPKFGDCLTRLGGSRRFQPAIYTVVHKESESEVQNIQILQENLKNNDFGILNQLLFNPIRGLNSPPAPGPRSPQIAQEVLPDDKPKKSYRTKSLRSPTGRKA